MLLRVLAVLVLLAALVVGAHMALIEVGREVVTLRTRNADGTLSSIRLWCVDHDGAVWLHSAGDDWLPRFAHPIVQLERGGRVRSYRARPVPGPHPELHRLLREKYGVADRWVRIIGPDNDTTVPVRLDPLP